jgi:hypothetical protein
VLEGAAAVIESVALAETVGVAVTLSVFGAVFAVAGFALPGAAFYYFEQA